MPLVAVYRRSCVMLSIETINVFLKHVRGLTRYIPTVPIPFPRKPVPVHCAVMHRPLAARGAGQLRTSHASDHGTLARLRQYGSDVCNSSRYEIYKKKNENIEYSIKCWWNQRHFDMLLLVYRVIFHANIIQCQAYHFAPKPFKVLNNRNHFRQNKMN